MKAGAAIALLLITAGALALRAPHLDQRPLHTDEAVHTIKFKGLWEEGTYRYDPNEYHGPLLYYATLPFAWANGSPAFAGLTEGTFRAVPVAFGVGLILLLCFVRDGQGTGAVLWSALFTAFSPAMVFYSRYYIHEMLLVFSTFLLLAALWRYARSRRPGWMLLAGLALGLMDVSKETFVFPLLAMAGAAALVWLWDKWVVETPGTWCWPKPVHVLLGLMVALGVSVLFFSSFLTNPSGPLDSLRTYVPWFDRAHGQSPHVHPWLYYLDLLSWHRVGRGPTWSEGLILALAVLGIGVALSRRSMAHGDVAWVRFIAFYTLLLTALYSAVPYKTPWCLLGFLHGCILLAGIGAVTLIGWARRRAGQIAIACGLVLGTGHLAVQAYRASYAYADSQRNPYVYAQTLGNLLALADRVEALARCHPDQHQMLVKVMARGGDYWPLPWYLRRFSRVGYWSDVPEDAQAPVVIASPAFGPLLELALGATHEMAGYYGHRPGVFLQLYVERRLWADYLAHSRSEVPAKTETAVPDSGAANDEHRTFNVQHPTTAAVERSALDVERWTFRFMVPRRASRSAEASHEPPTP